LQRYKHASELKNKYRKLERIVQMEEKQSDRDQDESVSDWFINSRIYTVRNMYCFLVEIKWRVFNGARTCNVFESWCHNIWWRIREKNELPYSHMGYVTSNPRDIVDVIEIMKVNGSSGFDGSLIHLFCANGIAIPFSLRGTYIIYAPHWIVS
jgi:hypothetical protein